MRLKGKVAIITGGANGIGRATALLFAREGASVVIADRDREAGEDCAAAISSTRGEAWFVPTDVANDVEVAHLVMATVERYGGLDILVNCAAVDIMGSVVDTKPARWQRVLEVNLSSVYRACRFAIPEMRKRGGGSIVNVSSVQALYGFAHYAAYAAAKAGILGLTRQVAVDYAGEDIRCNAISPGGVATSMTQNSARLEPQFAGDPAGYPPEDIKTRSAEAVLAESAPLQGLARPEDVAYAALFFASDESAHVSGQNLIVDGGQSARG